MNGNETRKTKRNNKTAILEKLTEPIMIEEVDSEGIEDLKNRRFLIMAEIGFLLRSKAEA